MSRQTIFLFCMIVVIALGGMLNFSQPTRAMEAIDQPITGKQTDVVQSLEPQTHPILSDIRVRRAIAYCTDKDALVAAVYPGLTPAERQALIADTFIHPSSWAYSTLAITYPYNPAAGMSLLEDAGWVLPVDGDIRMKEGVELVLPVSTTTTQLRVDLITAFTNQMHACGIYVIPEFTENLSWLAYRDFDAAEYAWVFDEQDPGGAESFACDQVPSPENDWMGGNSIGWCNPAASDAIIHASDLSLTQLERQGYYATFIDLFAEDIPILPLFFRQGTTNVWEHIDFNLETYAQNGELTSGGTGSPGLNFLNFQGNQHTIAAPARAVTQTVTLRF